MPLTFNAAFLGTVGSIIGHSYIALSRHDSINPKTLSELAAAESRLLRQFRYIAFINSTLLAITIYLYIAPRNAYGLVQSVAWSLEYAGGILMLIFPAKDKFLALHNRCALLMAVGMYALAYLFLPALKSTYMVLCVICIFIMTFSGIATFINKQRYLIYELIFIFISHLTICIAALGI